MICIIVTPRPNLQTSTSLLYDAIDNELNLPERSLIFHITVIPFIFSLASNHDK